MAIVYARVAPKRDTKKHWGEHPDFIPFRGEIIIYMDYKIKVDDNGNKVCIPGLKIGDGKTAVNDLPFMDYGGGGGSVGATINGVPVEGDLTLEDLGIQPEGEYPDEELSEEEIDDIIGMINESSDIAQRIMESDYVDICNDLSIDGAIQIDHDIEIDLDGHTLSATFSDIPMFIVTNGTMRLTGEGKIEAYRIAAAENGGKIVIDSGIYTTTDVGFTASGDGSKITMNDGSIFAVEGGLGSFDGAEIEMNGGTINCSDNFCLFTNGTAGRGNNKITLNGGILVGNIKTPNFESVGVYIANNDMFEMNGGSIVSTNGCGILMRAGSVALKGGSVETRGSGVGGKVGDSPIVMDHSAVIYHESANYPGKAGMNLVITGGNYTGVEHSVSILSNETAPNVQITGGVFYPAYPEE